MPEDKSLKFTITDSVSLLVERQKNEDWIFFVSPEGLRYLHLRYSEFGNSEKPFSLMFKRCPELKNYYPKIREWFAENDLTWKDKVVNGKKYMAAELEISVERITDLIISAQNEIFNISKSNITSRDSSLSMKLSGIKAPFIGLFCAFGIMICLISFLLYQVLHFPSISNPSLKALKWEEAFAIIAIPICYYGFYISGYRTGRNSDDKQKRSNWKNLKLIVKRLLMLALLSLAFFTY